jgi:polar amino acid transport system substrate-binding protein
VPVEAFPWPRALALTEAVPDTLLFTVARTPEREALFHWIGPFAEREIWMYRLVSRSDIKVSSLDDAKYYKVGISLADATATSLLSQGFVKGGNLDITTFAVDIVRKMKVARVDLTPLNPYSLPTFARDAGVAPDQLEPVFLYTREGGYYLALNKQSSPALLAKLDAAFAAMVKDGGLAKIIERWRVSQGLSGKVVKQARTKK